MTRRTPAYDRICDAAVVHFASHGYDAASLSEIASLVGIRKASLYSHFAGKDALFLQVLQDALVLEGEFASQTLAGPPTGDGPGGSYVAALAGRFESSAHLRFLLRAAYLPPPALKEAVSAAMEALIAVLRAGFLRQLREYASGTLEEAVAESYGEAYLGIVDALCVELIYVGTAAAERRRAALWGLLAESLARRRE